MNPSDFSKRLHHVIPGGAHTYSRGDDQFPGVAPSVFVRGKGPLVWDSDETEYVDWGMGINNVLIGHAEDAIDDAAVAALRRGQSFSRPTPLELDAAEAVLALFPGMDMIKFAKNGSDGNSGAIRLARAITNRSLVAYDGTAPFLSIHDWFIGRTVLSAGIPEAVRNLSVPFAFNDTDSVEKLFRDHAGQLAAVIMETARDKKPEPSFLMRLRTLCDEHGTLLIFDEVVTGFRYALSGAYSLFGVIPDFVSIGKGIANGYALSAVMGKRQYMERGGLRHDRERVFFLSTTNGPEQSALAAALRTVQFYKENDVIGRLYGNGQAAADAINAGAGRNGIEEFISASGDFSCRPVLRFCGPDGQPSMAFRSLFLQEMLKQGIFMPWICPSFRHGPAEARRTANAANEACAVYAKALASGSVDGFLSGPVVKPVFRKFN
jgi:glutamate-1-semialdehyde 2,1-aminomutase